MAPLNAARRAQHAVVLAASLVIVAPAHGDEPGPSAAPPATVEMARWHPYVAAASARFGVPISWIERVMRAESGGRTSLNGRPITSPAGAMGLMQIMPATWSELRKAYGLGPDPHDPQDNIMAGTAYLRQMYDRFGYPGLFAAYNAGPARYGAYLAGRQPLPSETRAYMVAVTGRPAAVAAVAITRIPSGGGLFAIRRVVGTNVDPGPTASAPKPAESLFAVPGPR